MYGPRHRPASVVAVLVLQYAKTLHLETRRGHGRRHHRVFVFELELGRVRGGASQGVAAKSLKRTSNI